MGKPSDGGWFVWNTNQWGPFGQEEHFLRFSDAEKYLKYAYQDAVKRCLKMGNAVYVARVIQYKVRWKGFVYHGHNEVAVDFSDNDLTPDQMRELGIL